MNDKRIMRIRKNKQSQVSMEFIMTMAITLIIFISVMVITTAKQKEMVYFEEEREYKAPCDYVTSLIVNVYLMGDGAKINDKIGYNFTVFGRDHKIMVWKKEVGKNFTYYCNFPTFNVTNGYNTSFTIGRWTNFSVENVNGNVEIRDKSLENGLILWLKTDEKKGDNHVDDYVEGNDGAITGDVTCTKESNKGLTCSFAGDGDDYISVRAQIMTTNNVTYGGWIYWNTVGGADYDEPIGQHGGDDTGYLIYADDAQVYCWDGNSNTDGYRVDPNTWYHVMCRHNGTNSSLWVDGQERGAEPSSDNPASEDFVVGGNVQMDYYWFNGKTADVRVYNKSLSDAEITALYESYESLIDNHLAEIPR